MIREKLAKQEKVSFILSVIIIVLMVVCIFLIIFNEYFKKVKLDIDSLNVQRLYSYVDYQGKQEYRINGFSYEDIKVDEELLASDIKQENKNYMGMQNLLANEIKEDICVNHDALEHIDCGIIEYTKKNDEWQENTKKYDDSTYIFTNESLNKKVLTLFGYGSYKLTNKISISENVKYNYDTINNMYVFNVHRKDEALSAIKDLETKLESAILVHDRLEITESISDDEKELAKLTYIFKLDDTNNYYLYSIKRIK